jgi:hypothetical protein
VAEDKTIQYRLVAKIQHIYATVAFLIHPFRFFVPRVSVNYMKSFIFLFVEGMNRFGMAFAIVPGR